MLNGPLPAPVSMQKTDGKNPDILIQIMKQPLMAGSGVAAGTATEMPDPEGPFFQFIGI
jgi:hypothetical protein